MSEPTTAPVTDPRVLFVDDEATIRYSFQRAMQRRGFAVDVAESGAAAIEMASRAPYAVVATDLNMPGMNGIQLVEQLHRSSPEASFVLVTGANELDLPTESESARAITCIIQKPWDAAHMADALQRATELHVVRRETRDQAVPRRNGVAVLLVEDTPNDARLVRAMLAPTPRDVYAVTHVQRLAQALVALESQPFDVVLVDLSLADARGMDAVARLQAVRESVPIIVMSSECDEDLAQQVVQRGAQDYIVKGDMNAALLRRSLHYAVERKSTEERLASLAHFDQLTGLANRTQFGRRVGRALVRAKQSGSHPAVLFLDLDRFKAVNDTLGHAAGDQLLREVARRLSQTVRSSDTVARLGGDEFAILLEDIAIEERASTPARRIIEALTPLMSLRNQEVRVTTSIGIAVFPEDGTTIDDLLRHADSAMYRAKENGRNNYQFFDQEMHARARLRLELERDVSGALERGEFSVHYQPLANVSSSQAVRFEALLRWQHPRLGPISPAVFIPLLEDLGHIVPVGEWVLDQACAQLRQWQLKYDPELRVAVNVSARQFDDPEMVAKVERALRAADLAPQSLELEVTEGMLMRDIEDAGRTLRRLDALGVHIAIDDFGTGYSQLVYLAKFPIHVLKVDRSVVETIGQPEGDRLVAAVIRMGQTLGLEVVAEGVEQESQLAFLRREHCDVFQGYLMSRPMAAADCERWLAQARQRNAA